MFTQISIKMANPVSSRCMYDIRWNALQDFIFTISENLLILVCLAIPVHIEQAENAQ